MTQKKAQSATEPIRASSERSRASSPKVPRVGMCCVLLSRSAEVPVFVRCDHVGLHHATCTYGCGAAVAFGCQAAVDFSAIRLPLLFGT